MAFKFSPEAKIKKKKCKRKYKVFICHLSTSFGKLSYPLKLSFDVLSRGTFQFQTYDIARNAMALALSPVVKALVDPDGALRDIRNLDSVRIISFLFLLISCPGHFVNIIIEITFSSYRSASLIGFCPKVEHA